MKNYLYTIIAFLMLVIGCIDSELVTPGNEFNNLNDDEQSSTLTADINGVFTDFSLSSKALINVSTSFSINGVSEKGQLLQLVGTVGSTPLLEGTYTEEDTISVILTLNPANFNTVYANFNEEGKRYPTVINITKVDMENFQTSGTFSTTVRNTTSGELIEITNGVFEDLPIEDANASEEGGNEENEEGLFVKYTVVESGEVINFTDNVLTLTLDSGITITTAGFDDNIIDIKLPENGVNVGDYELETPNGDFDNNVYSIMVLYKGIEYVSVGGSLSITSVSQDYIEGTFDFVGKDEEENIITIEEGSFKALAP